MLPRFQHFRTIASLVGAILAAYLAPGGESLAFDATGSATKRPPAQEPQSVQTRPQDSKSLFVVSDETVFLRQMCKTIETEAVNNGVPPAFLAKLIWKESRFDPNAISPAGAEGIAQFMPSTAAVWDLENAFEPTDAIKASARLLGSLFKEYGNLGLAAAAYNAGENRVDSWRRGRSGLPGETRNYVYSITGYKVSEWKKGNGPDVTFDLDETQDFQTACEAFRLIKAPLQRRFANTYFNRGLALARQKDYESALLKYMIAIRLKPDFPEAYNNRGLVYRMLGDYETAIANYNVALRMKSNYPAAYNNRGYAKRKLGQFTAAIADYNRALTLKPDYASALFNRGFAQAKLGNHEAAILDYTAVLKLTTNHPLAYYNRGLAYLASGHPQKAKADLDIAIAHSSRFAKAYHSRANVLLQLGQQNRAKADYQKSVSLNARLGQGEYEIKFD
jgi:tetratricopeptide (TPR) repeat protein